MEFLDDAKDAFAWIAQWARARLWHAMALAFVLGLGVGAML
jgi:hypothetical protein